MLVNSTQGIKGQVVILSGVTNSVKLWSFLLRKEQCAISNSSCQSSFSHPAVFDVPTSCIIHLLTRAAIYHGSVLNATQNTRFKNVRLPPDLTTARNSLPARHILFLVQSRNPSPPATSIHENDYGECACAFRAARF